MKIAKEVFVAKALALLLQFAIAVAFRLTSDDSTTLRSGALSRPIMSAVVKEVPPPPPPPFHFEDLLIPSMTEVAKDSGYHPDFLRRLRRDARERDHWGKPKVESAMERKAPRSRGSNVPYVNRRLTRRRQRVRQNQRGVGYDYDDRPTWLG